MSYITKRPEGAPSWVPAAVLCRVRDETTSNWQQRYIINYDGTRTMIPRYYIDDNSFWWRYAEPIEAWQPAEGEIVAAWENDYPGFCISKFIAETTPGSFMTELSYPVDHIARLVYPDGRVIDCTCDVETLHQRVGEGNWI